MIRADVGAGESSKMTLFVPYSLTGTLVKPFPSLSSLSKVIINVSAPKSDRLYAVLRETKGNSLQCHLNALITGL